MDIPKADPALNPNHRTPLGTILARALARAEGNGQIHINQKRLEDPTFQAHCRITVAAALAAGWAEAAPERHKK